MYSVFRICNRYDIVSYNSSVFLSFSLRVCVCASNTYSRIYSIDGVQPVGQRFILRLAECQQSDALY
jgi:hypothetical protein